MWQVICNVENSSRMVETTGRLYCTRSESLSDESLNYPMKQYDKFNICGWTMTDNCSKLEFPYSSIHTIILSPFDIFNIYLCSYPHVVHIIGIHKNTGSVIWKCPFYPLNSILIRFGFRGRDSSPNGLISVDMILSSFITVFPSLSMISPRAYYLLNFLT